jgi:SecD/SecF fusion protein
VKSSKRLFLGLQIAVLLFGLLPILSLARGENPFRLGLDLAGGTRITYRPDLETRLQWTRDLSDQELLEATKDVLASRLGRVLATIPDVVVRGDQRIVVSVPGEQDRSRVLDLVGRTYRLTFRLVEPGVAGADGPGADRFSYRGAPIALGPPAFSGEMLEEGSIRAATASSLNDLGSGASVSFRFQSAHEEEFAEFTARNVGRQMAILIDDDVEWVGTIESAIRGTGSLEGGYSLEDATEIAMMLRAGTLPVSLSIESLEAVTPSLGREVQELGLRALCVSLFLLALLVTVAYAHRGWLLLNGLLALVTLLLLMAGLAATMGLTLDMVGIAAVILSVGMGMDGFILVFESLSARLSRDGAMARNRSQGLSRQAYSLGSEGGALLHGNATTLLVVLLLLGNERLHSFAVFVTVGVAASVLTILLTRESLRWTPQGLPSLPFDPLGLLRRSRWGLFRLRALFGVATLGAALVLGGLLVSSGPERLRLGDDFTPGSQLVVEGERPAVERAVAALRERLPGVSVRSQALGDVGGPAAGASSDQHPTTTSSDQHPTGASSDRHPSDRHLVSLSASFGDERALLHAGGDSGGAGLEASSLLGLFEAESVRVESLHSIDGKVSAARLGSSLRVLLVSFLLLGVYFTFFQERLERLLSSSPPRGMPRSVRAHVLGGILVALAVDLVFVFATMALLGIPINLPIVGALLSIVGYSVNDSVVLWSHIRRRWTSSRSESPKPSPREVVMRSVDEILSRAVLTSLSTLVPALTILLVGLDPLRDFAVVLAVGTVVGTCSSLFVVGSFVHRALERTTCRHGAALPSSTRSEVLVERP